MGHASQDPNEGAVPLAVDNDSVGIECSFSDRREKMPINKTSIKGEKLPAWFTKEYDDEWPLRIVQTKVAAATAILPFSKAVIDVVCKVENSQYTSIWASEGGASSVVVGSPTKFIVQTPKDGGPFCSFVLTTTAWGRGLVSGVYCITDDVFDCSELMKDSRLYSGWRSAGWQIQVLPVAFLAAHVSNKAKDVSKLNKRVAFIEKIVTESRQEGDESLDFGLLTRKLHECHTELFRLERRAHFEEALAKSIETLMDAARADRASGEDIVRNPLRLAQNMMESQSYDLRSLPKRIESQRVMIFNLILQRDSRMNLEIGRTNMEIADTSRRIAEASMRDSASMKTIAILTMLFLPGTAVASFFSMTMFNWEADKQQGLASSYIWIYFVTSVPLTAMVLGVWWWSLRRRRAARQSKFLLSPRGTENGGETSNIDIAKVLEEPSRVA